MQLLILKLLLLSNSGKWAICLAKLYSTHQVVAYTPGHVGDRLFTINSFDSDPLKTSQGMIMKQHYCYQMYDEDQCLRS